MEKKYILEMVSEYYKKYHSTHKGEGYQDGDYIPYASRVYDHEEMVNLVDSALDFWLTTGRYTEQFEKKFAAYLGIEHCILVNSGSSANLIAFMALTSPLLADRAINRGDEVITVACGFPTTVAPITQYGAVPVFVDVTIPQYNIDVSMLEEAVSEKTKAVMLAHTLGNPFDISTVKEFCDKHKLWLIEDNCDALGSMYTLKDKTGFTGTFGDIGTSSFYPPHHMTMGEGGAVYTNNKTLYKIILSLRDWGRDCACPSGHDDLCGHRFNHQYGELPLGYDHKYVYSHMGYNLKATDMQAAIGCAQLKKLLMFVQRRKENYHYLRNGLVDLSERVILPEACKNSDPSWFGFPIMCTENVQRDHAVRYIEGRGVQTRMLFAGNIVKQPCFDNMRESASGYRQIGELINTNRIMTDMFWVGVYPGLSEEELEYMVRVVREAVG